MRFCKLKITPIVVFVIVFQSIFPSRALAPTQCMIVDSAIYFYLLMNSAFLVTKRLLCLYDKQNLYTKLFISCSTWHLTRSLRSLVSYQVEHSKRKSHIYVHPCIILYLSKCLIDWVWWLWHLANLRFRKIFNLSVNCLNRYEEENTSAALLEISQHKSIQVKSREKVSQSCKL